MFPMVEKPYDIVANAVYCDNVIRYARVVSLVAELDYLTYCSASDVVTKPGAKCAFYVVGVLMNGKLFRCLVHRDDDGLLSVEPANVTVKQGRIDQLRVAILAPAADSNAVVFVKRFDPRSATIRTGRCANHGINYSQFTTVDADIFRMAIEHYLSLIS